MKRILAAILSLGVALVLGAKPVTSPNGKLSVKTSDGKLVISYEKQSVLEMADIPFKKLQFVRLVKDDYRMLEGKRLHCTNQANEYQAPIGKNGRIVMRVYDDGIAFRYEYKGLKDSKVPDEQTAYIIPEGSKRWMQQWSDGYEGFFPMTTTAEVKTLVGFGGMFTSDKINTHWGYPLLMEPADGVFALITEANIERRQSASSLFNEGEVFRVKQDQNDLLLSGDWHTPWRVVIIGHLSDIVESTLVTDVSEPCKLEDTAWIKPGVVSWIYWAYNHGSNDYHIIRKYVDLAATLHLPYVLIDAEWDEMDKIESNEGKTIEDAVAYALSQGVKPLIWYNSSIGWVDGAPGPKFRLNKPEDREKEFAWCEKIGVAGVKIDFFSGDTQANMDYCQDLIESAARHHLLVNFHGAPIPRGWQRTYPNLLSTEGVYGAEWYNNVAHFTQKAASHNATLPYTRNVIGPMDYTPCAFSDSQHPHITSNAHELALTVLYESGLQHLADRPESFLAQPQEVQDFLGRLPVAWDETRFVSGYPGESAVLARRRGSTWYVAGINGLDEPQTLATDLGFIGNGKALLFADDADGRWKIVRIDTLPKQVECRPRGGFVLVTIPDAAQVGTANPDPEFKVRVNTALEPIGDGPYEATVESLSGWTCPEWFRDAKFGIWAHWGPQCQPEDGDWFARNMYEEKWGGYRYTIDARDHPTRFGFKDWIHEWKAENWDPDALIKLYKETGARYFMALANHHDNFDLYDSKYQSWNSVAIGPEKDIVGGWAEACRKYGLRLGVSVHAARAWNWYEPARGSDSKGPLAGVPYDGWLTKEDGKGTWWEGLDPQELYEQRHPLSKDSNHYEWEEDKVVTPDQAYCDKLYNRTVQLIDDYNPDIVYFDDTYLPLWPVSDAGLKILAHGYNRRGDMVFTGKVLTPWQKETLLWDVERGAPDAIQELPWQTCTCIGSWHYDKHIYYQDRYKTAAQVITMLVDVVSKNGNLLLSIPVKGDGTIDPTELRIVKEIGHWMQINGESIYETRPWVIYGEGPATENKNPIQAQGFNEGRQRYSAADIRFNKKGDKVLYVTLMGVPEEDVVVKALGSKTAQNTRKIKSVTLLGSEEKVAWIQSKETLTITKPAEVPSPEALVYKVVFK